MGRKRTENTRQLGIEIAAELADELDAVVASRNSTKRAVVEMALRRHFANLPPMPDVPPLPPVGSTGAPSKRIRKRLKSD